MWSVATHFPWSVCVVDTLLSPAKTAGPIVWAMDLWGPGNHFSGDILDPPLERALLRDILGTPSLITVNVTVLDTHNVIHKESAVMRPLISITLAT